MGFDNTQVVSPGHRDDLATATARCSKVNAAEAASRDQAAGEKPASQSLGHMPAAQKWQFDESVTHCFDDMLERSIPQYKTMREACTVVAKRYRRPKTDIVDLGCSRGGAIADLIRCYGSHNRFVGCEVSQPMRDAARERFDGYIKTGIVDIRDDDLRLKYPPVSASVTMAVLTIQFTPIEYRPRIFQDIYDHTQTGGALILVEKVLGESAELNGVMVDTYHAMKAANGYSSDEIERKRLSLEGVLVPVSASMNVAFMQQAGFRKIDCFWRWMNFAAWCAVK